MQPDLVNNRPSSDSRMYPTRMTIQNVLCLARRGAATFTVPDMLVRPVMWSNLMADAVNARLKWPERPGRRFIRYVSSDSYHTSIMAMPETHVTTLPNGIRVATESRRDINIATVSTWFSQLHLFQSSTTSLS